MPYLFNDFETFSQVDLTSTTQSRYGRHPSTVPLMLAWAVDDGPVQQWVPAEGQPMPPELLSMLRDPHYIKSAYNAPMERAIWRYTLGVETPIEQWRCTMAMSMSMAFPAGLEKAGAALGLRDDARKDLRGGRLIRKFCAPYTTNRKRQAPRRVYWYEEPEDWQAFREYNVQDIHAERAIHNALIRYDMPPHEWDMWRLDQEINDRGVPISRLAATRALEFRDEVRVIKIEEMRKITGLENPGSQKQLLEWLQRHGYPFDDLTATHVSRALEAVSATYDCHSPYKRVLELRQEVSKNSHRKYDNYLKYTDDDGRIRGCHIFAAAGRTWRWGSWGVQVHNMPRATPEFSDVKTTKTPGGLPVVTHGGTADAVQALETIPIRTLLERYPKPMDMLASATRSVVQASPGHSLVVFDLNAIENRVLGFLAREPRIQRVFENDLCPYLEFSTILFGGTYAQAEAEYKAGNKHKRQMAKPPVLGCGYMLSAGKRYEDPNTGEIEATGLVAYAMALGVDLEQHISDRAVVVWRNSHPMVLDLWRRLQWAVIETIKTGRPHWVNDLMFEMSGEFLRMWLPSGRALSYQHPRVENQLKPWGKYKDTATYMGKHPRTGEWVRISTHPGKTTENADQAVSRDIFANGIKRVTKAGFPVVLHVHDEVVVEVPDYMVDRAWPVIQKCMEQPERWAPSLVLRAEGFASKYWLKD